MSGINGIIISDEQNERIKSTDGNKKIEKRE